MKRWEEGFLAAAWMVLLACAFAHESHICKASAYLDAFQSFLQLGDASRHNDDVGALCGKLFRSGEAHAFGRACEEDRLVARVSRP